MLGTWRGTFQIRPAHPMPQVSENSEDAVQPAPPPRLLIVLTPWVLIFS